MLDLSIKFMYVSLLKQNIVYSAYNYLDIVNILCKLGSYYSKYYNTVILDIVNFAALSLSPSSILLRTDAD